MENHSISYRYCSAEHQSKDYGIHKRFCKAITKIRSSAESFGNNDLGSVKSTTDKGSDSIISSSNSNPVMASYPFGPKERAPFYEQMDREMGEMVFLLGAHKFGTIYNYLLFLEPRCLWCYKTKSHTRKDLLICPTCQLAGFCGENHRSMAELAHKTPRSDTGFSEVNLIIQ